MALKKNISAYSVIDFNQCEYKSSLDFIQPPKDFKPLNDPWLEIIRKIGIDHENKIISTLGKESNITIIDDNKTIEERIKLTSDAINSGDGLIYQGFISHNRFNGIPDLLIKKKDYYEPCDIKSSLSLKTDNIIQLCHYAHILKKQFGLMPKTGKIILRDESEIEIEIKKYYDYYLHISENLSQFLKENTILEESTKCTLCSKCTYKNFCEENWEKSDNLNQVTNIRSSQIKTLLENNINSMTELAKVENIEKTGLNSNSAKFLIEQAKLQKNYQKTGKLDYKIIYNEKREIIDEFIPIGFQLIPNKDANDLFFDIEGYPMFIDPETKTSGLEYLFGIHFRTFGEPVFKKFLSTNHDEEKKTFEELIDFFYKHIQQFNNSSIYHYGSYEITALQRLSTKYNTKNQELDHLLRNHKFVDLYRVIKDSLLLSTNDYKLKTIEKFYNFTHDSDVASGEDSLVAFENYLETNSKEILNEIILYNKFDCESTEKLRDWILSIMPKNIEPFVPPPEKEISEARKEKIAEEKEIIKKIDKNFEKNIELGSTLKELLNYGWNELRPDWWEYFENSKKDVEELLDQSNCIGGLEFIKEHPGSKYETQVGYIAKIVTLRYPNQVVKLKKMSSIVDSSFENFQDKNLAPLLEIQDFDYSKNEISVKIICHPDMEKQNYFPKGIIENVTYFDMVVDRAVKSFLSNENKKNFFPAIYDFLNKNNPRYKKDAIYNSKKTIEDISDRIESLNNSYLFVQGPPGTGKTHTSSRVIVNLMKKNYKVAILCNSHSAIINLLNSVDSYAKEINYSFNGIYRRSGHESDKLGKNIEVLKDKKIKPFDKSDYQLFAGTGTFLASKKFIENCELEKSYDYIFFDEAGQLKISYIVGASMATKNIILVGDHMQLPQPSNSAVDDQEKASLSPIEYIMEEKNTIDDKVGIFLNKSYRMHSKINDFISENFYENRLISDEMNDKQNILVGSKKINGIHLIDLNHKDSSVENETESEYIKIIYNQLLGKSWIDKNNLKKTITEEDILVITPYNAQVINIKNKLHSNSKVGTVDLFQGQEAPIVLASYTTSSQELMGARRGSDFLFDFRRLNVSISRAKALAVVLFNKELLNYNCSNVDDMERLNYFCKLKEYEIDPMEFMNLIR